MAIMTPNNWTSFKNVPLVKTYKVPKGLSFHNMLHETSLKKCSGGKIQIMWEGHKIWIFHFFWNDLITTKQSGRLIQIFAAFYENLNFTLEVGTQWKTVLWAVEIFAVYLG